MGKLIYSAITSLDGYIEDEAGKFDWAAPDEEVHQFVNDLMRTAGTHLYGRRVYEVMAVWETMDTGPEQEAVTRDFAEMWRSADKVVYSTTLEQATTARTRIERSFDPEVVRRLKAESAQDLIVGGPALAAEAFRAGLVDECHLFLHPIIVGGGKAALPKGVRMPLELVDEGRFASGVVHLHYRARG